MINSEHVIMFTVIDSVDFVDWVQNELSARGMTQSDIARAGGITRSAVSRFLNRQQKTAGKEMLSAIAKAFQMPIEEIYRIAGEFPNRPQEQPPGFIEWMELYLSASPEKREDMLEYARFKARQGRNKPAQDR